MKQKDLNKGVIYTNTAIGFDKLNRKILEKQIDELRSFLEPKDYKKSIEQSLMNIVNNKEDFEKELSEKLSALKIGNSLTISINGNIQKITKISKNEVSISR